MGKVSDLQWALFQLNISDHSARFMLSKSDFRSAYRNCPIYSRHLSLADILIRDPQSGKHHRSGQLAMPFGAVAAVYAWDRLGSAAQALAQHYLLLPVSRYVDDLFWIDHFISADSSRAALLELFTMLGLVLDVSKTPSPEDLMLLLGVRVSIARCSISGLPKITLLPEPLKVLLWLDEIERLSRESLAGRPLLLKLLGRLSFACSSVWGARARARLRPLYDFSSLKSRDIEDARLCLDWWRSRLQSPSPRECFFEAFISAPVIIYSDADGSGGLGWMIFTENTCLWAGGLMPADLSTLLLPRKTQIHALEMTALIAALHSNLRHLHRRRLLAFVDNQSAVGALKKGSSSARDLAALAEVAHALAARCSCELFLHWVPSSLNLADPPSRGLPGELGSATWFSLPSALIATTLRSLALAG